LEQSFTVCMSLLTATSAQGIREKMLAFSSLELPVPSPHHHSLPENVQKGNHLAHCLSTSSVKALNESVVATVVTTI